MNNLAVKGDVEVCGITVPNISGGFGVNKKAMLVKHIAELHERKLIHVNEAINDNIHRFKENVDIIDVKNHNEFVIALTDNNVFTKMQVSKANNIYLLSERGYAKLIKIFNDDKSWDLYDQLLDEYFELREENNNVTPISNTPVTQAEMLVVYAQQFVEQERRLNQIEEQSQQVNNKVVKLETEFNKESLIEGYKSNDNLARKFNLYSLKNKPHFGFIDAIAKHLRIYNAKIGYDDEYIKAVRETLHGGTVGTAVYYSDKAEKLINDFLKNEFNPEVSLYKRGANKGKYYYSQFELDKTYKFAERTYKQYS